jgi:phosphatidate cytidylyltransferase
VPLLLSFYVLVPLQYALIGFSQYGTYAICIPVYAFLFLPAAASLAADTQDFLTRSAKIHGA